MKLNFTIIDEQKRKIPNCNTLLMSQKTYDENIESFHDGYYKELKIKVAENASNGKVLLYCSSINVLCEGE